SDNGTEFKIEDLNQFCGMKGIKREFSVARTPQHNGIAERKNMTLIKAARTMLANSLLAIPFWAEAVNTACYVQNRVLVTKPHNKTLYKLLLSRKPSIGFMRPFGCPVTIHNTLDPLGKFQGKVNEGFLVGYSVCSKAFRVFNSRTRIVQEALHVNFMENKLNVAGSGPAWLFDIDSLSQTMNYHLVLAKNQSNLTAGSGPAWLFDIDSLSQTINYYPVLAENQSTSIAGFQDLKKVGEEGTQTYVLFLMLSDGNQPNPSTGIQEHFDADKVREGNVQQYVLFPLWSSGSKDPQNIHDDVTFEVKEPESKVHVSPSSSAKTKKHDDKTKGEAKGKIPAVGQISTNITNTFSAAGPSNTDVSPTLRKSSYMDPSQYPDDPNMPALEDITYFDDEEDIGAEANFSNLETNITVNHIPTTRVHKDHPVTQIIGDLSSSPQTRSMTRMVKEQVARIEAIRLFLAYASFMGFMVYQMNVKSVFLYGTIEEEALYGLHQAPRAWYETLANYLLENGFHRGQIDQTLFIKKQKGDILLVQVYFDDIIFGSTNKDLCKAFEKLMKDKFQMSLMGELTFLLASTPIDTEKPSLKDPDDASEGFEQILDFERKRDSVCINGKPHYLCIKQFWSSISIKKTNDVVRLQALIDRRKVIITEDTVRQALYLDDAESIDCLPNEEIFAELARMRYEKPSTKLTFYKAFFSTQWKFLIHIILQCMSMKRTAWNEFSSSMASAVICLATGRKFNFSKYIFDCLAIDDVANVAADNVDDIVAKDAAEPTPPSPTPTTTPPPPPQEIPSTSQVAPTLPPSPIAQPSSPPQQQQPSQPSQNTKISMDLLNTLLETYTTLTRKVEALEQDKIAQALEITKLKQRVRRLEKKTKIDADEDVILEEVDAEKDAKKDAAV
nr:ribonuclease H-like domain-containing protein [Tanacetum cinerariifolium]